MENIKRILSGENQFSSPELSQKLFELNVSSDTCFIWVWNKSDHPKSGWSLFANSPYVQRNLLWNKILPAYSCAELGEMLPYEIYDQSLILTKCWSCWQIKYSDGEYLRESIITEIQDDTEANCRAKMLIYLIENKLINISLASSGSESS